MNPERRRIDDRQLDEALRTIAAVAAPPELRRRVLDAIRTDAPHGWLTMWRPALAAVVAVAVLAAVGLWLHAPPAPRQAQGAGLTAQATPSQHPRTVAPRTIAPPGSAPAQAEGTQLATRHSEPLHLRSDAPLMSARAHLRSSRREAEAQRSDTELPPLEPPDPLTIARLQNPELSERQLGVNALHVPALEIETLER